MSNISQKIDKGKLLIASPATLTDRPFNRSVILLVEHNSEGSVGFIMNKPTGFVVSDFISDFDCDFAVYNGGPVERDHLYYIHRVPGLIPGSEPINGSLSWGGEYQVVKRMIENKLIHPSDIRFFLGYSGWSPEQLEMEIEEKAWILTENDYPDIFKVKDASHWRDKLSEFGGDYSLWLNSPDDPMLN